MRQEVIDLVALGKMPSEDEATDEYLKAAEVLLNNIKWPITEAEAKALLTIVSDAEEDSCYGLAWTLLHTLESYPRIGNILPAETSSPWIEDMKQRGERFITATFNRFEEFIAACVKPDFADKFRKDFNRKVISPRFFHPFLEVDFNARFDSLPGFAGEIHMPLYSIYGRYPSLDAVGFSVIPNLIRSCIEFPEEKDTILVATLPAKTVFFIKPCTAKHIYMF